MIADELREMDQSGQLKRLLKSGVIPVKVKIYYDIYRRYEIEYSQNLKCKNRVMQSVTNTSDAVKVCESTVFKAIKLMQT